MTISSGDQCLEAMHKHTVLARYRRVWAKHETTVQQVVCPALRVETSHFQRPKAPPLHRRALSGLRPLSDRAAVQVHAVALRALRRQLRNHQLVVLAVQVWKTDRRALQRAAPAASPERPAWRQLGVVRRVLQRSQNLRLLARQAPPLCEHLTLSPRRWARTLLVRVKPRLKSRVRV